MADVKITGADGLTEIGAALVDGDYLVVVDVSDTTQSADGSTRKLLTSRVTTKVVADITTGATDLNIYGNTTNIASVDAIGLADGKLVKADADGNILDSTLAVSTVNSVVGPVLSQINDANGNEVLKLIATASAVNEHTFTNAATGTAPIAGVSGGDTNIDHAITAKGTGIVRGPLIAIPIAMSDRATALTTGIKWTYYMPRAFTLFSMHGSVTTAPTGATLIVDVHKDGTTVMTTSKIVIDVSEFDTSTAATAPALTTTALAAGSKMEFEIDQIGSTVAGTGLTVTMLGYWT